MKNTEEMFLMENLRNLSILCRWYTAFDLQQQKYQTDAQQDVSDPGHAGNGRVHTGGKRSFEHLSYAPHNKHDSRQVQADVIDHKNKKLQLQYGDYLIALHFSCFGKTKWAV